jgi:type I restriction enzyme S subunit
VSDNTVHVGELALNDSGAFKIGPFGSSLKKSELVESGIFVAGIENVLPNTFVRGFRRFITPRKFHELADYEIFPDDVLVTTMGTIGRAACAPRNLGRAIFDSHLFRMRVDTGRVFPPYLCYALNSDLVASQLASMARGAIMDGLNTTILRECSIPLPGLPEQRRIAGQLNKADRLRRARQCALELTDSFLPAAFLKLFGTSAAQFTPMAVEDLADDRPNAIRTGPFGSQLLHSEFTDSGIAVLGIDNAVNNRFVWDQRRFVTPGKYEQLKRYTVFPGDVIITIMGTCGRCAIVPDNIPTSINTKHLCCITLDSTRCLPVYLQGAFLYQPFVRRQLRSATKGAIMDGLNMEIIKHLRIPIPSLPLQQTFAALVGRVERLRTVQQEARRQAEHLFDSLLHRVFTVDRAHSASKPDGI